MPWMAPEETVNKRYYIVHPTNVGKGLSVVIYKANILCIYTSYKQTSTHMEDCYTKIKM